MTPFLEQLAARRRFGMKPGLEAVRAVLAALGNPERRFRAIHVAGTNGKGAVSAMLDAALGYSGAVVGRYTSPHLVRLNERFCLRGKPLDDTTLDAAAHRVEVVAPAELTFFEGLTAMALLVYAETHPEHVILETGLGGRLDATNVCIPELCVITRIGLDHCDWLGDTVEKIAAEKAGIIKPGVPIVLGENTPSVRAVIEERARALDAPFHYAPELASENEIPSGFALCGTFNRENAVTALAALKVLGAGDPAGLTAVVWPGRFQRVRSFIIDGAHNPPAAAALARSLAALGERVDLIAGFCGDKDVDAVLRTLAPFVSRALAVRTNNPRSLAAAETDAKMRAAGMDSSPCDSLREAIGRAEVRARQPAGVKTLVCGSLFLAGEALVELGAYPWENPRFDPSERLKIVI